MQDSAVVKSPGPGTTLLAHILAQPFLPQGPWACDITSLCFSFLICKMRH